MNPGTPLPWTVDPADDLPPAVIEDTEDGYGVAECGHPDDAAYIVHAANLHPELVKALERIATDLACYPADASTNDLRQYLDDCFIEARTALAKCKPDIFALTYERVTE